MTTRGSSLTGVKYHRDYQHHYDNDKNHDHKNNNSNNNNDNSHGSGYSIIGESYRSNVDSDSISDGVGYSHVVPSAAASVNGQLTPPNDFPFGDRDLMTRATAETGVATCPSSVGAWLEIWDYAGGTSFRAFVSEGTEDHSLFVFFDAGILGRDLKKALVALIELAEGPLECCHMMICIDRSIPEEERKSLMKGLQWAGFSLTTLDYWTGGLDVTSRTWLFMDMEI